jgi:ABC-2 type transport system ATP-binding protein
MSDHTVQTTDLGRDFGMVKALDGFSMTVPRGTILTLLGPNGAGKTTLLRILMGLIEPTRGEALVLGTPARSRPADVAGHVAYVGDRCEPANWVSSAMLENLQMCASKTFDGALYRDYCKQRDISPKRPYGSLSKGQRRWVLTSLALACRPHLILLDEPADGLDPSARKALYDAIRDHVNENDATAIVTTHIIGDVQRVADEVAIIGDGRLILHAPLEDLRERVRQVEIPASSSPPDVSEVASLLGCVQLGTTSIVWIKRDGLDDDQIRRQLGADVTIRHVGLEPLYLAIAEHRPVVETSEEGKTQ